VGYEPSKRYPLVIMAKGWGKEFLSDTGFHTAFPPQPLANAGFLVLMASVPPQTALGPWENSLKKEPGNMAEANSNKGGVIRGGCEPTSEVADTPRKLSGADFPKMCCERSVNPTECAALVRCSTSPGILALAVPCQAARQRDCPGP
jgi:hypothetical protein